MELGETVEHKARDTGRVAEDGDTGVCDVDLIKNDVLERLELVAMLEFICFAN